MGGQQSSGGEDFSTYRPSLDGGVSTVTEPFVGCKKVFKCTFNLFDANTTTMLKFLETRKQSLSPQAIAAYMKEHKKCETAFVRVTVPRNGELVQRKRRVGEPVALRTDRLIFGSECLAIDSKDKAQGTASPSPVAKLPIAIETGHIDIFCSYFWSSPVSVFTPGKLVTVPQVDRDPTSNKEGLYFCPTREDAERAEC